MLVWDGLWDGQQRELRRGRVLFDRLCVYLSSLNSLAVIGGSMHYFLLRPMNVILL